MSTEELNDRLLRLARAGAKMRVAQNDYFRVRGPATLEIAKKTERQFDTLVKEELKRLTTRQQDLF